MTEDVYDSPTGKILLIPQGARLIGQYDAQVAFGQSRALLVWNRLIMPNGRSIVLERQPGADPEGYAGLEDEVDNHWGMLFKAAILSTLLSVGSEAGAQQQRERSRPGPSAGLLAKLQPGRRAGRRALPERPADHHHPAGISGPRAGHPRPRSRTLSRLRRSTMAKLKLGAIADDKPVKLTIELPAALHRDLVAYAEALGRETGTARSSPPS